MQLDLKPDVSQECECRAGFEGLDIRSKGMQHSTQRWVQ